MQLQHDDSAPDLVARIGAAPVGGGDLVIAADAAELPYLRVGVFALQFQFLHAGWNTELSGLDSESVARSAVDDGPVPTRGRPMVLVLHERSGAPGAGWELGATFEGAELWRRE